MSPNFFLICGALSSYNLGKRCKCDNKCTPLRLHRDWAQLYLIKNKHRPLFLQSIYSSIKCMIVGSIRFLCTFEVILIYCSFKCLNLLVKESCVP